MASEELRPQEAISPNLKWERSFFNAVCGHPKEGADLDITVPVSDEYSEFLANLRQTNPDDFYKLQGITLKRAKEGLTPEDEENVSQYFAPKFAEFMETGQIAKE